MTLLFDANLSPLLAQSLSSLYPQCIHVQEIGLRAKDSEIWDFALQNDFAIVTKDTDFEAMSFLRAPPGKVILITLGNCATERVADLLESEEQRIQEFLTHPLETLLIIP